MRNKGI